MRFVTWYAHGIRWSPMAEGWYWAADDCGPTGPYPTRESAQRSAKLTLEPSIEFPDSEPRPVLLFGQKEPRV